ncbi:MAG: thiamine pyrophosphate-dependent enzyme possible carboligase or decarboxylase, partial [Jatrophihabitantaceae bacterium]|nr:thiamine pyrophosphate-dependent enzyme possible carboligase or decarboxylase [Jatrophihabitantaceae bacterium]
VAPAWPRPHAPAPDPAGLAAVIAALSAASRVVIFAGGGSVDASAAITALAITLDAPVITTTLGKGVLNETHPLAVGEFTGSPGTAELVNGADVALAFGTELGGFARYPEFGGTLIRFDIDTAQLQKNVRAHIAINSDSRLAAEAILAAFPGEPGAPGDRGGAALAQAARAACLADMEPYTGKWLAIQEALRAELPDDVIITGDSSQVSYMGTGPFWQFPSPRNYLVTTGYSTLGYALPAAIGAKLADRDRAVVALLGDGALMFSIQEFVTAAEVGLALPVVIIDNHGFAEIRENMIDRDIQPLAVTLARPDFAALAVAMNCFGVVVTNEAEAAKAAVEALGADRPTLIILEIGE